ncbi:hypothetical protein FMEXI_10936 [Fusarium mexicanum]|uniref:Uncharacterized protein n=1 Tax=Fusarium mexicanum TaxID=751941 RepID=A0A8H5IDB9_9HYPO|nr:hypothetical protein FMEXI_10936 [Fusarium mexicanum]
MGFWSSLVDGVKSAGGWVLDHAGDIAGAVGTVAKIAGTFAVAAESDDETTRLAGHQKNLALFHRNFDVASGLLKTEAREASKQVDEKAIRQRSFFADDFTSEDRVRDYFTGIWKNPSALLPDGTPAVPMYQDLSKWLGALGVPVDQSLDVSSEVGKAIFAIESPTTSGGEVKIKTTKFSYTDPKGKWTLDLGHAYYPLPLGATSSEYCWHSCVYGRFHPSKSLLAEMEAEGEPSSTIFVSELKASVKPMWVVNASINWGNQPLASNSHKKLIKKLEEEYKKQNRSVVYSTLEGVMQSVQLQASAEDNPSLLRQGLITAASTIASEYQSGRVPNPGDGSDTSSDDSSGDSSPDEMGWHSASVKSGTSKLRKTERIRSLARTKPVPSSMPLNVPEVDITKSQVVFKK